MKAKTLTTEPKINRMNVKEAIMKNTRRAFAIVMTLIMCLSLSLPAAATGLCAPTRGIKQVGDLLIETISGPYKLQPITRASKGTYHYHAQEERNSYSTTFPFNCNEGVGSKLDISVDNSTGDVPLNVYVYYGGKIVEQYLLYAGETETTYISSTDNSYLTGAGKVVVKPANGGNSVYWLSIYQHI